MSVNPSTQPHPTRGFTTAQLLHLAAIATANYINRHPELHPTKMEKPKDKSGHVIPGSVAVKKQVKLTSSNDVYDMLSQWLGLPKPTNAKGETVGVGGVNMLGKLASAKKGLMWFNNGVGEKAFTPRSPQGNAINAKRQTIYGFLNTPLTDADANLNGKRMIDYVLDVNSYAPTTRPGGKGEKPITAEDAGSKLHKATASSFQWHGDDVQAPPATTKYSLADNIVAVNLIWGLTNPAVEPVGIKRTGHGGVGQPRAASVQQANQEIARSSGFVSGKALGYLLSRYEDPSRYATAVANRAADTQEQKAARAEFNTAFQASATFKAALQSNDFSQAKYTAVRKALEQRMGANVQQINAAFRGIVDALGGLAVARQKLWIIGNEGKIAQLLAGNDILTPGQGDTRGWLWSRDAQADANTQTGFTRGIYDSLFNKFYVVHAADNLSQRAATRVATIAAGGGVKPKGILGTDDKSFESLSVTNPEQVAKFIKKARTGQFSMNALQAGAKALGIPVDPNAIMHEAVIGALVDGVVRLYGPEVDKAQAGVANAFVLAVGAAVGIQSSRQMTPEAIRRKLDAKYGLITSECAGDIGKKNYTTEDLKRVAKALAINVSEQSDHAALCGAINAALAAQGRGKDAPSQVTSQPRSLREHATGRASSGRRGGGAARAVASQASGAVAQMLAKVQGAAPAQSQANLQALAATNLPNAFGPAFGPTQPQPNAFGPTQPQLSPRSRMAHMGQPGNVVVDQNGQVIRGTTGTVAGQQVAPGTTGLGTVQGGYVSPRGNVFAQVGGQGPMLSPGQTRQLSPGGRNVLPFQAAGPTSTGGFL